MKAKQIKTNKKREFKKSVEWYGQAVSAIIDLVIIDFQNIIENKLSCFDIYKVSFSQENRHGIYRNKLLDHYKYLYDDLYNKKITRINEKQLFKLIDTVVLIKLKSCGFYIDLSINNWEVKL